jgi:hypothetical protein
LGFFCLAVKNLKTRTRFFAAQETTIPCVFLKMFFQILSDRVNGAKRSGSSNSGALFKKKEKNF